MTELRPVPDRNSEGISAYWVNHPDTDDVPTTRTEAFGQNRELTLIDRLGIWLSARRVRRLVHGSIAGARIADIGCGYHATLLQALLDPTTSAVAVDIALAPELREHQKIQTLQGALPEVLTEIPTYTLDIVLCINVLEHLWEPLETLHEIRRILAPSGVCVVNVPSWLGKWFLEFAAFRLSLSPAAEMDDHKAYYGPRDLWTLLVRAGFRPSDIRCGRHKFGLNTFAVCRAPSVNETGQP